LGTTTRRSGPWGPMWNERTCQICRIVRPLANHSRRLHANNHLQYLYCRNTTTAPGSRIDLHAHAGSAFDNHVTLTFDLFTSGSMHAQRLPCTVAYALYKFGVGSSSRFPFRVWTNKHTDTQTQLITTPTVTSMIMMK